MSEDIFYQIVIGILLSLIGWIFRMTWVEIERHRGDIESMREEISRVNLLVVGNYVTHNEFDGFVVILFQKLDKIADKMDRKQDKESFYRSNHD